MTGRVAALEIADPRRVKLAGLLVLLLVLAQMLFAAHAGDVADHAPQSCEYCLSASIADDPNDLIIEVAAPTASFNIFRSRVAADIVVAGALRAANPRGPPLL